MAKKKLGEKYDCYQCGCKFYDLSQPRPICPKCGADQNEARTKARPAPLPKAGVTATAPARPRGRRRRHEEDSIEPEVSFSDDQVELDSPLEDGLTMIDDEELSGAEDFSEED